MKSYHQRRVEEFMLLARQTVPNEPTIPNAEIRKLRARLILEEALETVAALGVVVQYPVAHGQEVIGVELDFDDLQFHADREPDLAAIIDGCCDVKVVTTGTLSACGISDVCFQNVVDQNNLDKFGPGHSIRADGKLIKPPGHKPPDIAGMLAQLM